MKTFIRAAIIRAIKTIAQTALSMITLGMGLFDVDWKMVISIAIMSGIYSVLTSIVTGLPEVDSDGELIFEQGDNGLQVNLNLSEFKDGARVIIKSAIPETVNDDITIS